MRKKILYTAVLLNVSMMAMAQSFALKGNVKDDLGEAVIGATVRVEGSKNATVTDLDGNFTLPDVKKGQSVTITYVGYAPQTKKVSSNGLLTFQLQQDSKLMDEVVVVGYGTMKKANLSGSVSSIKASELPTAGQASLGSMLRGRAAGMDIRSNSASPGASLSIAIRGGLSGQSPLIVIDGVPQSGATNASAGTGYSGVSKDGAMINLNPDDIESVDVLKDASAAAIYGSDASGGVILITTKRGKIGKPEISYSGSMAFSWISDMPEFMNAKEFMTQSNKLFDELGRTGEKRFTQEQIDNFVGDGTKWIDEVTRTGIVHNHSLSVTSGGENTKLLFSTNYYKNEGIAKNNDMERITGRLNVDQNFGKFFKAGINTMYSQVKYHDVPLGDGRNENSALIYSAMTFLPTVPVKDSDGKYSDNPYRNLYPNPVSLLEVNDVTANKDLSLSGYLQYTPIKDLMFKVTAGVDIKDSQHDQYVPTTVKSGYNRNGIASKYNAKSQMNLINAIAQYTHVFADKHDVSVMGGWEYKKQTWEGMGVAASDFPFDAPLYNNLGASSQEKPTISSYKGSNEMASFIGRLNYTYADRYILTANFRVDGSSNFAKNHQWGFFPGVSVGWRMKEESWLKNVKWLYNLKLRVGIGQTGNAGSLTGTEDLYGLGGWAVLGGKPLNSVVRSTLGNPNLRWETLTDYSFGIDFGLWNNRLSGTIDFFDRRRTDIIHQKSLLSYHELNTINYNSEEVQQSRGFDINLHSINFDTKNFGWTTAVNFSYYRNRTTDRESDFVPAIYQSWKETHGDIWVYKSDGLVQPGELPNYMPGVQAGAIKVLDLNGIKTDSDGNRLRDNEGRYVYSGEADGTLDEADYYKLGNSTPIPFSINNTFRWKNWDANIYIYGSLNGWKLNDIRLQAVYGYEEVANYGVNALKEIKNRWSYQNQNGTLPGVAELEHTGGVSPSSTDFFYERAWYLRLDNISLGYTFPKQWMGKWIQNLRVYASLRNIAVLTPYKGMDPETGNGIGAYPNSSSFAFGLNVKF